MDQISDLRELLKHELKDLYSAETQLIESLPKMVEAAKNDQLKKALSDHLKVTRDQKKRLEKIQELLNIENDTKEDTGGFFANLFKSKEGEEHCKAMEGLIKEGESLMGEDMEPHVMDAAIIAAAQKIEHYEIGSYGTARAYAEQMGMKEVEALLRETLDEEYFADDSLTKIAIEKVNIVAETVDGNTGTANNNGRQSQAPTKASDKNNKGTSSKNTTSQGSASNGGGSASRSAAPKKAAAEKAPAKKSAAKKATATRSAAKKSAPKKSTATKSPAKKSAPKKATASKSGNRGLTKNAGAKKSAARASEGRNAGSRRSAAKKSAPKKSAPKKSGSRGVTKAAPAKKSAAKKSAPKKVTGRSATTKNSGNKKAAPNKSASRGVVSKKSAPKKTATKKSATKKSGAKKSGRRR